MSNHLSRQSVFNSCLSQLLCRRSYLLNGCIAALQDIFSVILMFRNMYFVVTEHFQLLITMSLMTVVDINECSSNPCQNGGTCTDLLNGYQCACDNTHTGVNCERGKNVILYKSTKKFYFKIK